MAKPKADVNVGATTAAAVPVGRALPAVNVDPNNPNVARLLSGATTAGGGVVAPALTQPAPAAISNGGIIVEKLRISMTAEAMETLDRLERAFRIHSGENISSGRVMRAGLRVLAQLHQNDLIKAIEEETEAARGRPTRN